MIFVDRSTVAAPDILNSDRARLRLEDAAAHYRSTSAESKQQRYKADRRVYGGLEVREALIDLFKGKCAYCETRVEQSRLGHIDHFRPISGATDLKGGFQPAHYWWLAYEWRNLYLVCSRCNRLKGDLFPVTGRRVRLETPCEDLATEKSLLLDPCVDKPGRILVFDEYGRVASEDKRGQVTIEVFSLNRKDLVYARRKTYDKLKKLWEMGRDAESSDAYQTIANMGGPESEYAGLVRQFVLQWITGRATTGAKKLWSNVFSVFDALKPDHKLVSTKTRRAGIRTIKHKF